MAKIVDLSKRMDAPKEKTVDAAGGDLVKLALDFVKEASQLMTKHRGHKVSASTALDNGSKFAVEVEMVAADGHGNMYMVSNFSLQPLVQVEKKGLVTPS